MISQSEFSLATKTEFKACTVEILVTNIYFEYEIYSKAILYLKEKEEIILYLHLSLNLAQ